MSKVYVYHPGGVVHEITPELPDDLVPGRDIFTSEYAADLTDITARNPKPAVGWLTSDHGATFRAPPASSDPSAPASGPVPSCSKLGLIRAFRERGWWPTVKAMIASDADMQDDWNAATELRITDPTLVGAIAALPKAGLPALTDADVLALVDRANELVA